MSKKLPGFIFVFFLLVSQGYAKQPPEISFLVERFKVEGEMPLDMQEVEALLEPYRHRQYDLGGLQKLAKMLEQEIRDDGYSFYRVIVPPQTLSDGAIRLKIISFPVNRITVKNNQYFDEDNILASMPGLDAGESPNTRTLTDTLKVANRHPFKELKLTFKQSEEEPDRIDAQISVNERRPYQAFLIMNNTGTDRTGEFRMTGIVQHGNLWNLDHVVSGSYTTSPDHANTVQQYGVNYSLPVYPLRGWLSAYYAFSDVDNGVIADVFTVTGSGEMYGLHYQQFLPRIGRYEHWLDLGIDNRFFMNDVEFSGTPIGTDVRSAPFSILYKGEYPFDSAKLDFHVQWVGNTDFGGHNTDAHYQASRANAVQDWDLLRYGANLTAAYKRWVFKASLSGQYSHKPLIPGEQLGIGGTHTVRGYDERETSADTGEILNLELYTPRWHGFNLLAFYDYGHGRQQSHLAGERESWTLDSVGAGIRWQWKDHVFASVDFAHALNEGIVYSGTRAGTNRIHASLVLRF